MKMHRFLAPIVLAALSTSLSAQTVTLRGKVEDNPALPGTFMLGCTDTALTSAGPNLVPFDGLQVQLTGTWNGSSTAPSVDVTSIATAAKLFEVGGGGTIGKDISFKVTSAPGDLAVMFAALDANFVPAHSLGVLFLSLTPMLHVATGTVAGDGTFEVKGTIPNDPALDGVVVYGQAVVGFTAGGATLSNPDCVLLHN
jgi:hypothetical protein